MIINHMKLFGTNQVQAFHYFSGFKSTQKKFLQKEGFEVSSLFKDGIQARTIKIDVLKKPT